MCQLMYFYLIEDKLLPEPIATEFGDACVRHQGPMN